MSFKDLPDRYPDIHPLDADHPVVDDGEGLTGEPFDFANQDINAYVLGKVPTMIATARLALAKASSRRGFEVAAFGVYEDREGGPWQYTDRDGVVIHGEGPRIATIATANFKSRIRDEDRDVYDVDDIDKNCAETNGLIIADNAYFLRLHTNVVVATTNEQRIEGVNDERTPTLCLCSECSGHYKNNSLVDDNTLIITAGSGEDTLEIRSNKQLQRDIRKKAKGEAPKPTHCQQYRASDWPLRQQLYMQTRRQERMGNGHKDRIKAARLYHRIAKTAVLPSVIIPPR